MAARRKRWIAIGGATAAVAIGALATVALGAPSGFAVTPGVTHLAAHLTWSEGAGNVTGYDVQRAPTGCAGSPLFGTVTSVGPTVTTFDDTPPANGAYCYRVVGHYPDGAEGADVATPSGSAPVVYDTVAPMVSFASPQNNAFIHGVVTVAANASDPGMGASGVAGVTLSLDGGAAPPTSWNTAGVSDGPHVLQATATDAAGNQSTTAAITVNVDNHAPEAFTVTAPSPVAGKPTLSWPILGPYTYTLTRDGTALGAVSSPWTDSIEPPPGTHTYVVTATDSALNTTSSAVSVLVVSGGATQPRSLSAASPTNSVPHLTWQKPTTFAVTSWEVSRDGVVVGAIGDPDVMSFDDTGVGAQGPHVYTVQAKSGGTFGQASSPISVIYDTAAPALGGPSAVPNPDGSVGVNWPDASDPTPGSGVADYVVRRGAQTAPPGDPTAGTAICTVTLPAATGCIDSSAQSGSTYGYSVFALDGAGNVARQTVSAKAFDAIAPDPVSNFHGSVGPTNANLVWDAPARQGKNADLAGFRIIKLATGVTQPTNPKDGSVVCPDMGFRDGDCYVQNLTRGKPVTFAIYSQDEVPNYSTPVLLTLTPKGDNTKPHKVTKVRVSRVGARVTLRWVSPKDPDLSHFVVNLNKLGPAKNPGVRPIVFKGRKLTASFKLKAGQIAYANIFSVDLSGNYTRVTRLIVMPDKLIEAKSKKKAAKKVPKKTTAPKKKKKKTTTGTSGSTPVPVKAKNA